MINLKQTNLEGFFFFPICFVFETGDFIRAIKRMSSGDIKPVVFTKQLPYILQLMYISNCSVTLQPEEDGVC